MKRLAIVWLFVVPVALAAAPEDAVTSYQQGVSHLTAKDVPPDPAAARQAFRQAADQGHSLAALQLGMLYAKGIGGLRDDAEALRCFSAAAAVGQREALYNKGLFLLQGRGAPRDVDAGLTALAAAAETGSIAAHIKLADTHYFGGEGIPANRARALPHVKAAAAAGDAWACNILGTMAEFGYEMKPDHNAALHWFGVAAEQGDPKAQGNLGRLLRIGTSNPGTRILAYVWLRLSSLQGEITAAYSLKDHVISMTPHEIAEGDQAVEKFRLDLAEKRASKPAAAARR